MRQLRRLASCPSTMAAWEAAIRRPSRPGRWCARGLGAAVMACLVSLAGGLAGGGAARAQQGSWSVAPSLPVPRQESGMVAVGNRIYVIGGNGADPVPDALVLVYDADARTWGEAAPVPEALHHAAAAVVDGKIYSIGGFERAFAAREPVSSVWVYDPARDEW